MQGIFWNIKRNNKFQFIEQLPIMAAALFSFLLVCYDKQNTRVGAVVVRKMNLNENAYTAGERQFVLYEYLRRNATFVVRSLTGARGGTAKEPL